MKSLLLIAVSFLLLDGQSLNAGSEAPNVYKESAVVSFNTATFEFSFPEAPYKLIAQLRTTASSGKTHAKLDSIVLRFRDSETTIDHSQLDDLPSPDLLRFSSSIVPEDKKALVAIYLIDDSAECVRRTPPSCGVVEFDWKVGESLRKLDYRK
jgi:hypothetical protein